MDEVTTEVDKDTASATAVVDAPAEAIFDFLRRPANHPALNGDGSVRGSRVGPDVLGPGDRFGMNMRAGLPYRMTNRVVEFEENRRITWRPLGGHLWRWVLEPLDDGRTRVTGTFDLSRSSIGFLLRLGGMPGHHKGNLAKSVLNVKAHFART